MSANLPLELVQKLLGTDSPLLELRFSPSLNIQSEVLAVYHSLLNLKNIPLLQEAYRYVVPTLAPCVRTCMHIYILSVDPKGGQYNVVCGVSRLVRSVQISAAQSTV